MNGTSFPPLPPERISLHKATVLAEFANHNMTYKIPGADTGDFFTKTVPYKPEYIPYLHHAYNLSYKA